MFVESPEPDGSEFHASENSEDLTAETPEASAEAPEHTGPAEKDVQAFNAEIAALQTKYEPALGRNVTIEISPKWWENNIDQTQPMPAMRSEFERKYREFRASHLQLMLQQQAAGLPVKELSDPNSPEK